MSRVITFGTFDMFHVGHLAILERARKLGSQLIVGVSSDALNLEKKGRKPIYSYVERSRIIRSLRCVDEVFSEDSLAAKRNYIRHFKADVLVMGDDWVEQFDTLSDICEIVYLPRTPSISTTETIERIRLPPGENA